MYGTFTSAELRQQRRRAAGDKDEFPWQMLALFIVILASYGFALYGCWDVATRLDVLADRSGSVMNFTSRAAGVVSTHMNRSLDEGDRAMMLRLDMLRQEVEEAKKESAQLQHAIKGLQQGHDVQSAVAGYERAIRVLFVQAERLDVMKKGLNLLPGPDEARNFIDSLVTMLSVVSPVTDLLPGHEVAFFSIKSSMEKISDVQSELAKINSTLESLDRSCEYFQEECREFSASVHFLDGISMVPSYRREVSRLVGNVTDVTANMTNFTVFAESEFLAKLLKSEGLVRDFAKLPQAEKQDVMEKSAKVHEAAINLTNVVHSQVAEMEEVLVLLRVASRRAQEDLVSLQTYAFSVGILTERAVKDIADFYRWTAMVFVLVAVVMALVALGYACYLEYVYENDNIARAFETDPAERKGCCWNWVNCVGHIFHSTGFYALILLQDAVSLALVLMTLIMGTVSLAQLGVAAACDDAPVLSEDAVCSARVSSELLAPAASCSEADILMCENLVTDMSIAYRTLLAAVVGTVVSCCIPRRLLVVWMSAHHSIQTAEVLADLERNVKSAATT
mmetsp:Transcript_65980/g.155381  ORF Transcript_65980/g.155381 Transcript_65980/m.155381 type:complete len:564 (+) Transcript_65980:56-1747(+)